MSALLRNANVKDVKNIHAALLEGAGQGVILPRSLSQLYNHSREFVVLEEEDGTFLGCSSLSIIWEDLAEVPSLYVVAEARGRGLGRKLVEACIDEARRLGIIKVFALTYQEAFFRCMGFEVVGKDTLPQKIWADCIHCVKFPDCDEIAMQRTL